MRLWQLPYSNQVFILVIREVKTKNVKTKNKKTKKHKQGGIGGINKSKNDIC